MPGDIQSPAFWRHVTIGIGQRLRSNSRAQMAKFTSPLLGYNNNVRYHGRVFHIQTEDSGVNHPHIITHLFMDGGRILKSVKTSYTQHLGTENMSETVRVMMKDQHKAMVVALKEGQFDAVIDVKKPSGSHESSGRLPDVPASSGRLPDVPASSPRLADAPRSEPLPASRANVVAPAAAPTPTGPTTPQAVHSAPTPVRFHAVRHDSPAVFAVTVATGRGPKREPAPTPAPAVPLSNDDPPLPPEIEALLRDDVTPRPAPAPEPKRPPSVRELTLDFDALERDAGDSSIFHQQGDLPPPPKNLFAKEPRTAPYRAIDDDVGRVPPNRVDASSSRVPSPAAAGRPATMRPRPASQPPPPAATAKTGSAAEPSKAPPSSLFSDDALRDQSLDEVILSYLAEDLEPRRK